MRKPKTAYDTGTYDYCTETAKRMFRTRGEAEKAVADIKRKRKGNASVYLCRHCHNYHLTHFTYAEGKDFTTMDFGTRGASTVTGTAPPAASGNWELLVMLNRMHTTQKQIDEWWHSLTPLDRARIFEALTQNKQTK